MAKVYLINPRRSKWDREAVDRVLKASGWKGGSMAHHRHHHHRGRHNRRNPEGMELVWGVAGAAGGFLITGPVASMVAPSGLLNYVAQGAVALGGGWLIGKFRRPAGWGFAVGGLASLAISLYRNFIGGGAGVSGYVDVQNPTLEFASGDWKSLPAYTPGGAPAVIPQAGSSGAAAVAAKTATGPVLSSSRFASRLAA